MLYVTATDEHIASQVRVTTHEEVKMDATPFLLKKSLPRPFGGAPYVWSRVPIPTPFVTSS